MEDKKVIKRRGGRRKKKILWPQKLNWEKEHPNQISAIKKSLGIPKEKLKKTLT